MGEKQAPIKLVYITTVPQSLGFLSGQVGYMRAMGFDVFGLSSPGELLTSFANREKIPVYPVNMSRHITPLRDLVSTYQIWRQLRVLNPQIVHALTPKGGLLGMIAAWLARVPVRVYHILGLPLITANGYKRCLLRWSERIACLLAHRVFCVSHSVRELVIAEGLCPSSKIKVFLNGSVNGVDARRRFNPERLAGVNRQDLLKRYGVPPNSVVLGFVGRIVRDKGLVELVEAWKVLRDSFPELHLLIVGSFEPQDPVPLSVQRILRSDPRIHHLADRVPDTEIPLLYMAMDILVLPTYREGLPVVLLEAAAMKRPVVATRIPGCVDAVVDGVTGILVPPFDALALASAIETYLVQPGLRCRHGEAGRDRVLREFQPEPIWEATYCEYVRMLRSNCRSLAGTAFPAW